MIGIVDYGSGNVQAIANIYNRLNIENKIINDPLELETAGKLILPGVGAFDATMHQLEASGLKDKLNQLVLVDKKPVLGICVGMQIMANSSDEGKLDGLGWIKAKVKKFDSSKFKHKPYLPHMGWNNVQSKENSIFEKVDPKLGFYFVHSYYFECENKDDILGTTQYGAEFTSSVHNKNIFGMQFHPEKSHSNGIQLLKNFATLSNA